MSRPRAKISAIVLRAGIFRGVGIVPGRRLTSASQSVESGASSIEVCEVAPGGTGMSATALGGGESGAGKLVQAGSMSAASAITTAATGRRGVIGTPGCGASARRSRRARRNRR